MSFDIHESVGGHRLPCAIRKAVADGRWNRPADLSPLVRLLRDQEEATFIEFLQIHRMISLLDEFAWIAKNESEVARALGLSSATVSLSVTGLLPVGIAVPIMASRSGFTVCLLYEFDADVPTVVAPVDQGTDGFIWRVLSPSIDQFLQEIGIEMV